MNTDRNSSIFNQRIVSFGIIGCVGFCVDAGVLQLLFLSGMHPLYARLISFPTAVTVTWLLNRRFTFPSAVPARKVAYALYLLGQILGALLNIGVFAMLIAFFPLLSHHPVLPLAAGAAFGMLFNFLWATFVVFTERSFKTTGG